VQIPLTIAAFIVAGAFFCFGFYRADKLNTVAKQIDDPKLRITADKSISVWLLSLLCVASLISLIWLFMSYGKLYNYEGGFSLRPSDSWQFIERKIGESEKEITFVYSDFRNDHTEITINFLNQAVASEKAQEIKQTRKELISILKEARAKLKPGMKDAEKELRAQAKERERELRVTFKGKSQERKAAIRANKDVLASSIENLKNKLKQDFADNRRETREVWHNGWLKRDKSIDNFIAIRNRRFYTVDISSGERLSGINIGPFGFFIGIFDGSVFPCTMLINKFADSIFQSILPYKYVNNGFTYILGFILGLLVFMAFFAWLICIPAKKISRGLWKKKWLGMATDEKVSYIDMLYEKEEENNERNLEIRKEVSKNEEMDFKQEFNTTPEKALTVLNAPIQEKSKLKSIGGFLANAFTAGGFSKKEAEEKYDTMKRVYDYFDSVYQISLANVQIANTRYKFICKKAVLYIQQIKELIENFTYEQKKQFDQAGKLELSEVEFNNLKAQELLNSIESLNKEFNINTKAMWDGTMSLANSMFKSGMGDLGLYLGLGTIVVAGAMSYFSNITKNNEITARLKEGQAEIRKAITENKKNKSKADNFVERADEICDYLEESMKRYTTMFSKISAELFPKDNAYKSISERRIREKNGESFYTNEEMMIIRPLGKYTKIMSQVIEADL